MAKISPLLMVGFPSINFKHQAHLLQQQYAHELVQIDRLAERELIVGRPTQRARGRGSRR